VAFRTADSPPYCDVPNPLVNLPVPHTPTIVRPAITVALVASVVAACAGGADKKAAVRSRRRPPTTTTTTTTAPPTTTTTAPPSTTTTARPAASGLGRGSRGPQVLALEQRLTALRFDTGTVDGLFDAATGSAVMAFQKVYGLPRTGRATADVLAKLPSAAVPGPLVRGGGSTKVEVDLRRQVLFLYQGGSLFRILPVSTGNGKRFCVDGSCATAVTPGGSFRVTRRISGWRTSRLGRLYNPLYFNGGIAIHGSSSVPAYPASHGCVRIPMSAAGWLPSRVPNGTAVYVVGGRAAPVPLDEPAPGGPPPPRPSTTTTTRPPAPPPPPPPTTTTTTSSTLPPTTSSTTTSTVPRP